MAGSKKAPPKFVKPILKYPSWFGSHYSMLDEEATAKLKDEEKQKTVTVEERKKDANGNKIIIQRQFVVEYVVCKDDYGSYKTEKSRLDNGLADPNRNTEKRLKSLFKKKGEEGKAKNKDEEAA